MGRCSWVLFLLFGFRFAKVIFGKNQSGNRCENDEQMGGNISVVH